MNRNEEFPNPPQPTLNPWIEPDLEARLVALVLGEASDFEREELSRLIDEKPELALFKNRIETLHALLKEAATGEPVEDRHAWKMAPDRRETLLTTIDGSGPAPSFSGPPIMTVPASKRKKLLPFLLKIAAAILVLGGLGSLLIPATFPLYRASFEFAAAPEGSATRAPERGGRLSEPELELGIDSALHFARTESDQLERKAAPPAAEAQSSLAELRNNLALFDSVSQVAPAQPPPAKPDTGLAVDSAPLGRAMSEIAGKETELSMPDVSLALSAGGDFDMSGHGGAVLNDDSADARLEEAADSPVNYSGSVTVGGGFLGVNGASAAMEDSSTIPVDAFAETARPETAPSDPFAAPASSTVPEGSLRERLSAMDREPENEKRNRGLAAADSGSIRAAGETRAGGRIELDALVDTKDKVVRRDLRLKPADNLRTEESALTSAQPIPALKQPQEGNAFSIFGAGAVGFSVGEFLSDSDRKEQQPLPAPPAGLEEISADEEAFSTFSLHVSDVSFKLAQAALAKGEWPEAATVRIEEFVNAFDYGDPMPSQEEKVACRLEQAIHPFLQQRNLLRVSMRTAAEGRSGGTPLRLTLLLDNSGSMERPDRQETVRRAFALLAGLLQPIDQVTLISFARQPRLLADKVSGERSAELVERVLNLPSEGGTNLEAALRLSFEKAREQQAANAQNRIVLLTDGAANLGDAEPESLAGLVETMRNAGIAFDAAGIGADGLNDEILEALTRKGDGRYYLLDRPEDADEGFARQIAGALRPAARNVKVQVEWNPARVGRYKLLGFEKHRLKTEDFRDDSVDAAEMAAAEAGVAVYQFEARADGIGDAGSVSVRFQDAASGRMIENRWPIPYDPAAPRLEQAAPSMRIAASAALFAAKLKGDPLGEVVDLKNLAELVSGLPEPYRESERVGQLRQTIAQARQIAGD